MFLLFLSYSAINQGNEKKNAACRLFPRFFTEKGPKLSCWSFNHVGPWQQMCCLRQFVSPNQDVDILYWELKVNRKAFKGYRSITIAVWCKVRNKAQTLFPHFLYFISSSQLKKTQTTVFKTRKMNNVYFIHNAQVSFKQGFQSMKV